jgi:hypothetical protein
MRRSNPGTGKRIQGFDFIVSVFGYFARFRGIKAQVVLIRNDEHFIWMS